MNEQRDSGLCEEFGQQRVAGVSEGEQGTGWREHLAGCPVCREQSTADALLGGTLVEPAPELTDDFAGRLHQRLEQRTAGIPATARPAGRLHPAGLWTLAAYVTSAAVASAVILSRLPWQSFTPSPALAVTLGVVALLSPLVLLDRIGIVRPPC